MLYIISKESLINSGYVKSYDRQTRISQNVQKKQVQCRPVCQPSLPESPVSAGNSKNVHLSHRHAELPLPSYPQIHDEVCRCKDQIVAEQILPDVAIPCPARLEQPLHNQEWMLHLAANGRFLMCSIFLSQLPTAYAFVIRFCEGLWAMR